MSHDTSHVGYTDAAIFRRALRMHTYAQCVREEVALEPGRSPRDLWLLSCALWRVVSDLRPEREIRREH